MKIKRYVYIRTEDPWFLDRTIDIKNHIRLINKAKLSGFVKKSLPTVESDVDEALFKHNYFIYHIEGLEKDTVMRFQTYWSPEDMSNIPYGFIDKLMTNRALALINKDHKSNIVNRLSRVVIDLPEEPKIETIVVTDKEQLIGLLYDENSKVEYI